MTFITPPFPSHLLPTTHPAAEESVSRGNDPDASAAASSPRCIASPYCVPANDFHSIRCQTFQATAAARRGDAWDRRSRYEESLRETEMEWRVR